MKAIDMSVLANDVIPFTFNDAKKTKIRLKMPTVTMVKSLSTIVENIKGIEEDADAQTKIDVTMELFAEIFSNNIENKKFAGKELEEKYNFTIFDAAQFFDAYIENISEIKNIKN